MQQIKNVTKKTDICLSYKGGKYMLKELRFKKNVKIFFLYRRGFSFLDLSFPENPLCHLKNGEKCRLIATQKYVRKKENFEVGGRR